MDYYKEYVVSKRDVDVQLSIAIPKVVVNHIDLVKGDRLRLTVKGKDKIVIEAVRRRRKR